MNMFKSTCARCGKEVFTYAKNKGGELPKVYCSKRCESETKHDKRMVDYNEK